MASGVFDLQDARKQLTQLTGNEPGIGPFVSLELIRSKQKSGGGVA